MADSGQVNEQHRLQALAAYDILDTAPEADFDDLVNLAADLCDVPIALISLIDARRQWFKARRGIEVTETPREIAFCSLALEHPDLMEVADASRDSRFADNPLVTGEPGIRFYAGAPLRTSEGYTLGTLCVIDRVPRLLTERQRRVLTVLASQVMKQLDLRRRLAEELHAEAKLRESERRFRLLADATNDAVWDWDLVTQQLRWNIGFETLFGFDRAEIEPTADAWYSRIHPDDRQRVTTGIHRFIENGRANCVWEDEYRFARKQGGYAWVRDRGFILLDADGRAARMLGGMTDFSALRAAERELQESSELMVIASDVARIGGWRLELFPRRVVWSEAVRRIHEAAEDYQPELVTALAFYPPHERPRLADAIEACIAHGTPFDLELQMVTACGRTIWVRSIGRPLRDGDGRIVAIQGACQDIDAPKRNEFALEQIGRQLQTTLESISDALFTLDRAWRFTYLNQRAEQLLIRAREELLGKVIWDEFGPALETAFNLQYQRAMNDGETVSFVEYYEPLATWFDVTAYPTPEGVAVYFRDVSEKIELEARLAQVQQLEAIGRLTGGVAHDFNNLLTVIIGNAELLAEELCVDHPLTPIVDLVRTAADRGAELTSRLLASARRQALEPRVVAPAAVIDGMGAMLQRTLGETVEVGLFHEPRLWPIFVDTTQLETALINLCVNARDAMPQGGKLTIETANVVLDENYALNHAEVEPGGYVQISISDTGIGMSSEQLARAFEPFFTTKPKGKGTGLGLSMVYGFVKQSGGHINLYSEEGGGTVVHLYLPRADSEAVEPAVAAAAAPQPQLGAGERILLVEDDALVREHAHRLLRDLGYRVTEAASGIEALALLRDGLQVDLLFTDVIMPGGLTGPQLAAAAHALLPALPLLYTSGYTENAIVHHGRVDPGVLLLHKPYRRATLAEKVRQALRAAPATNNNNNERGV